MNVIDRSFAAEADRVAKAERARRKRQQRIAIVVALVVAVAAIAYLCLGDDALRQLLRAGTAPATDLAVLH
jgi:hypothetical protein